MAKARAIPDLQGTDTFRQAAAKAVAVRAEELWEHSDNVLDVGDIERVHDMRVATRRLRAVLEIFAPCFPAKAHRAALKEVKALADALGERRDPDVQIEHLETYAEAAPTQDRPGVDVIVSRLRARQATANAELAAALAEMERSDLRGRLLALLEEAGAT
jgi:CHAD domain-containing protein